MSTKLKISHSFPKDRTIENSDISPSKQSAGDDDDEINMWQRSTEDQGTRDLQLFVLSASYHTPDTELQKSDQDLSR